MKEAYKGRIEEVIKQVASDLDSSTIGYFGCGKLDDRGGLQALPFAGR